MHAAATSRGCADIADPDRRRGVVVLDHEPVCRDDARKQHLRRPARRDGARAISRDSSSGVDDGKRSGRADRHRNTTRHRGRGIDRHEVAGRVGLGRDRLRDSISIFH